MKVLPSSHNSPETAYVIEQYPFGSGLVCYKRIWIESPNKGAKSKSQRVVYQTTKRFFNKNYTSDTSQTAPMEDAHLWNKEKKGVYGAMTILFIEEGTGYVKIDGLGEYPWEEHCKKFLDTYGADLDETQAKRANHLYDGVVAASRRHEERQKAIRDAITE